MLKAFGAVAVGFVVWVLANVVVSLLSAFVWGHDPDSGFSIAFAAWCGSTIAFVVAPLLSEHIAPALAHRTFLIALAVVVVLWAASALLGASDAGLRMAGLAGHILAAAIAIWQAKPAQVVAG
jgi:hypothetical protein